VLKSDAEERRDQKQRSQQENGSSPRGAEVRKLMRERELS